MVSWDGSPGRGIIPPRDRDRSRGSRPALAALPEPLRPQDVEVDLPKNVVLEPVPLPVEPPRVLPEPKPEPVRIPETEKPKPESPKPDPVVKPVVAKAVKPARTVKLAVQEGLGFLKSRVPSLSAGLRELVLWTFLHADVPDGDPGSKHLLKEMLIVTHKGPTAQGLAKAEAKLSQLAKHGHPDDDDDDDDEDEGKGTKAKYPNLKYRKPKYKNVEALLKYVESADDKGGVKLVIMNFND